MNVRWCAFGSPAQFTARRENASTVGSPHERSDMRERHVRLTAAPDIAPLVRATFGNTLRPSFAAKAGKAGTPRPPGSSCRLWNTGSSGQAGRRRWRLGHPSCPSFGIAAGHNSRLEQARNAVLATNRQWFWLRIWSSKGSGNADSQRKVRSSGWSGQGCPHDSGCDRAHPASWRASASYRPLRAVWAVCAWALRGSRKFPETLQRSENSATTQKEFLT